MENTKNLCAQIPESLHARVRAEQEQSGQTLSQYVTALITEYYDRKEDIKWKAQGQWRFKSLRNCFSG